jgi:hypothetical protein
MPNLTTLTLRVNGDCHRERGGLKQLALLFSLLARRQGGRLGEEGRGGEGPGGAKRPALRIRPESEYHPCPT